MNDPINESFSALLDDQATSMDVQRLLNAMHNQPGKIKQWQGLAQCQGQIHDEVCVDLLDQINEKLFDEQELLQDELISAIELPLMLESSSSAIENKQQFNSCNIIGRN